MYSVHTRKKPPSAVMKISHTDMPEVKLRARKRLSSTSGEPMVRARHCSYLTNITSTAAEPAIIRKHQSGQSSRRPSVSG